MKIFLKKHRYHFIIWIFLLLTSLASTGYLWASQKTISIKYWPKISTTASNNYLKQTTIGSTGRPAALTAKQNQSVNQPTSSARTIAQTAANAPNTSTNSIASTDVITSTFYVNEQKYELTLAKNNTVQQAMNLLSQKTNFTFSGKQYATLGFFVDEINGLKNNPKTNQYWIYYINGQSANVGVSSYIIQPNDIITWKYETSKF